MRYYSFKNGDVKESATPTGLIAREIVVPSGAEPDPAGDTECLCNAGIGGCKSTTSDRCFKDEEAKCIRKLAQGCNRS